MVSDPASLAALVEQLLARVTELESTLAQRDLVIAGQAERIAELERRLSGDSSNSSRPPSSDAPWDKKPAKKRSSRSQSGRKPGKQPGTSSSSRSLSDDPDDTFVIIPPRCDGCDASLAGAPESGRERRQVVDVAPVAPPVVTEYQRVSKICVCCGVVSTPDWDAEIIGDDHADVVASPGSPVRLGPETLARAALLTCGHYLPVGRSRQLLEALTGIEVSAGFLAGVRGRAARKLEKKFLPYLRDLLTSAPVLHADETTGRTAGTPSYVHVACTEYLTLLHVGGRTKEDIDAGGVLPAFTGVLVRDGYAGYEHLTGAVHAWCGAHLLRDLRSISDGDPDGQLWALAMADTLLAAQHAARVARDTGADTLDPVTLARIRNHYLGALARGRDDNQNSRGQLATEARTLIGRFRRFEDMILRFATDLTVPFTNNMAERAVRPVKIQQRTSGGTWRTLTGLIDFAVVQSYLDTAHKWGLDKLDALHQLFTTGAWLPPALTPAE
ncbi:IS66 family transposase [Amycolatopsis sp. H20-H5]|uniref:IS66 family transposase n=1 Tax=Amycolatopsis sp. H20-H5 TaxID=3046309 RepID=UPI002DB8CC5F|nr:IS66 family transposase [Amycolatopsis sp. H20-H5]MEC3982857.1 IS66 family transposase [Amycolatopsis sp. H20-H5]